MDANTITLIFGFITVLLAILGVIVMMLQLNNQVKSEVRGQFKELKQDIKEVRQDIKDVRLEIKEVRQEIKNLDNKFTQEIKDVRQEIKNLDNKFTQEIRATNAKLDTLLLTLFSKGFPNPVKDDKDAA